MRSLFRGLTQTDFLLIQRCPTLLGPSHGRVELSHVPFSFFYALYIALIDTEHFTRTGEGPCAKLGGSGGPLRVGGVDVVSWWSAGAVGLVSWSADWKALLESDATWLLLRWFRYFRWPVLCVRFSCWRGRCSFRCRWSCWLTSIAAGPLDVRCRALLSGRWAVWSYWCAAAEVAAIASELRS